jgi:hypothetical protein
MSEDEYKQAESLSLEMMDFLLQRASTSSLMLCVLVKCCALLLCTHKPDKVSFAKQRQAFARAFNEEMRLAEAFVKRKP